ncbi:MAG: hypothetical protein IIZ96_06695 [Oscillospiraceae bacterium]|nr:hypothetical protein [Oscillospiraceae bacterium]
MVEGEEKYKQSMAALSKSNESLGKSAGGLGDQIKDLGGKLGINIPEGATKALNGIEGFSAGSVAAMGAIAAGVAAVIKVIQELNDMTMEAAHKADDLMTKSLQTGVSTDMLQQWEYASELIDVSVETMTGSMTKLTRNMAEAASGSGQAAEAFAALGVSVTDADGNLRNANEVMFDALASLAEVGNATERDALAMEIFGRSAQELNPLILNLDKAQRLYNEAMEDGYVLSEEQLKILGEVDDAHQQYSKTLEKNRDLIAVQWAPAVQVGYELLQKMTDKAGKALIDSGLVSNVAALVQSTIGLFESASTLFDAMPSWLNPLKMLSAQLQALSMTLAAISDYVDLVSSLLRLDFRGVGDALGFGYGSGRANNLQRARMASQGTLSMYDEFYAGRNAAGTSDWRGGLTWVGEAGPELVALPRGSQIYSNQESRNMGGGTNVYNITVANIQELDELLAWFESRRIRGRME